MATVADDVRAVAELARDRAPEALAVLWRRHRAPELSQLIVELGARASFEPISERTKKQTAARFLEIAGERRAADLSRLLDAFPVGKIAAAIEQIKALAAWPDDPRTAHALLAMFDDPPYRSRAGLDFWTQALALVSRIADARSRSVIERIIETIDSRFAEPMRTLLPRELEPLAAALPAPEAVDADLAAALAEVRDAHGARSSAATGDADALLAEIHAEPLDDQLRLVYADACLAAGDPRGEVIVIDSLRAQGKRLTRQQRAREKEVLAAEGSGWLGDLERLLLKSSIQFRLGFLDAATIKPKHDSHVRPVIGDPRWSTVRALEIKAVSDYHNESAAGARDSVEELVCDLVMRSLRSLTGDLSMDLVQELCGGDRERSLESLAVTVWGDDRPELLAAVAEARRLPRLRELISRQSRLSHPAHYEWLFAGALYRRLARLELRSDRVVKALAEWFAFFGPSSLERLAVCSSWANTRVEFVREPGGLGLEARFRYASDILELAIFLHTLAPGSLQRIEVRWPRGSNGPGEKTEESVRSAVAKLAPATVKLPRA